MTKPLTPEIIWRLVPDSMPELAEALCEHLALLRATPSREAGPCGEKNLPGSHPCDAPKGHAPGSEPGGHFCRYSWTSREADR